LEIIYISYFIYSFISILIFLYSRYSVKQETIEKIVNENEIQKEKRGFPKIRNFFFIQSFLSLYLIGLFLFTNIKHYQLFLVMNIILIVFGIAIGFIFLKYGRRIGTFCILSTIPLSFVFLSNIQPSYEYLKSEIKNLKSPNDISDFNSPFRYNFEEIKILIEKNSSKILIQKNPPDFIIIAPAVENSYKSTSLIKAFVVCRHNGYNELDCKNHWKKNYKEGITPLYTKNTSLIYNAVKELSQNLSLNTVDKPALIEIIPSQIEFEEKNYKNLYSFILITHLISFFYSLSIFVKEKKLNLKSNQ
jgi:hypothetical protein